MKILLLSLFSFTLSISCWSQATSIYDDFDSYRPGQYLSSESSGLWTTWTNGPGTPEDTYVTNLNSFSPNNSIELVSGGVVDVVLPLGNENSGSWTLSFMMLVEEGYGAYFNLLHYFSAAASNWAAQFYFNAGGDGYITVGGGLTDLGTNFVYPTGEWFEVKVNIDVDGDLAELYFDNAAVYDWTWSEGSTGVSSTIAALNLYPNAEDLEPDSYFVDNVSFNEFGLSVVEIDNIPPVFPNPTKNNFFINTEQHSLVEIFNVLGGKVLSTITQNNETFINCSDWSKGFYFINLTDQFGNTKNTSIIIK